MLNNYRIIIQNGLLIDPANQLEAECDLLIERDRVLEVARRGSFGSISEALTIDAQDRWVVPGLIDLHVHLREPGFEWKETIASGSRAAVQGGYTALCCMPNTRPVNDCREVTEFILRKADEARWARVFPIGAVSNSLEGKELAQLSELAASGCVAFSDDGEPVYNAGLMRRALEWCRMLGLTIACHEEDKSITACGCMNESGLSTRLGLKGMPKVGEEVMVARDIELARATRGRVHICHVSTARSVELIRRAKNDNIAITAEVTPHHLKLTEDAVSDYDTNAKMSPPLRQREDIEALWQGLADGTIDAIASDHAPHDQVSKEVEFGAATFGILGLQTSLPLALELVRDGVLPLSRAIEVLSSGPARCFNLDLGRLENGRLADVTIIDPHKRWTFTSEQVLSLSCNSPFLGRELVGKAESVIVGGKLLMRSGELLQKEI